MTRCTAVTTTTDTYQRCSREAKQLVVWRTYASPSCSQHADKLAMGRPGAFTIDLDRKDRPCAICGKYLIAHLYDAGRVHPEPQTGHDYVPGLPPSPDPDGRCRSWMGWCFTHGAADDLGHYLATHPAVTPSGYAAND